MMTLVFLGMTLAAALFFLWPLLRGGAHERVLPREGINTVVFKDRLHELELDHAEGRLDDEEFGELKRELERTLLADVDGDDPAAAVSRVPKWSVVLIVVLLPLSSLALYHWKGEPDTVEAWQATVARWEPLVSGSLKGQTVTEEQAKDLTSGDYIRVLQHILQSSPDDVDGWHHLGIAYMQVQLPQYAETAFRRASSLAPDNIDLRLLVVESKLAQGRGGLDDAGLALLQDILASAPSHPKARMMMGMAAYNRASYPQAIKVWEELLADVPPDSEGADILRSSIERARQKMAAPTPVATDAPRLTVDVTVPSGVADAFPKPAFLMVYAKQVDGLPMPVAIKKMPFDSSHVSVDLSDSDAMAPMAKLSTSSRVVVFARLSQTGSAMPQAGDRIATSSPLTVGGSQTVTLTIE